MIGDCVEISADNDLINGVELCVPIRPNMDTNHTHFNTYDFARKTVIEPYGHGSLEVIEGVPTNKEAGRLLPGWSVFQPLQRQVNITFILHKH